MNHTPEDYAHALANASEETRLEILEDVFRQWQLQTKQMNQQRVDFEQLFGRLEQEIFALSRTCEHILNPVKWSNLPLDLQQRVFAHLPLRHILRLRVLSKTWNRYVAGALPGFTKVCDEVHPKIFGLLCEGHDYDIAGIMAVRIYDTDSKKWHRFKHYSPFEDQFIETMHAGDGGLVCIVSLDTNKREHPVSIEVFNPLTEQCRELPELPPALSSVQPSMLQLVMDRESESYKVIVVGPSEGCMTGETDRIYDYGGETAALYSSVTGQWSSTKGAPDLIFGYLWDDDGLSDSDDEDYLEEGNQYLLHCRRPCAYDCATDEIVNLEDGTSPWRTLAGETRHALVKDRLFVLHEETYAAGGGVMERQRYYISEYQAQRHQPHWIKLQVHSCDEFEEPPDKAEYRLHLYACNGLLLVTANNNEPGGFEHNLAWLYDLCKGEWQAISGLRLNDFVEGGPDKLTMFELRWDAVP